MNDYHDPETAQAFAAYEWWLAGQPHAASKQCRPLSAPAPKPLPRPMSPPLYYAHTDATGSTVLLGQIELADMQRLNDDARGGFAALVCGYSR